MLSDPAVDIVGESNVKFSLAVLNDVNAINHRGGRNWLRGLDLNQRPSGYEPDELPGCSTPRDENTWDVNSLQIEKTVAPARNVFVFRRIATSLTR